MKQHSKNTILLAACVKGICDFANNIGCNREMYNVCMSLLNSMVLLGQVFSHFGEYFMSAVILTQYIFYFVTSS